MRKHLQLITLGIIAVPAATAYADETVQMNNFLSELLFVPRAEIGMSDFSLRFKGMVPEPNGRTVNAYNKFITDHIVTRFGGSLIFQNVFLDAYYQTVSDEQTMQMFPELGLIENWLAERDEINITLGMSIFDSASVFVGYRDVEIEANGVNGSHYLFTNDGYYIGGSYRWDITESGSIALNAGFSVLDAKLEESLFGSQLPTGRGDGTGFKFGISWRDMLNERIGYTLQFDRYNYDHEIINREGNIDADMEEQEISMRLGLFTLI
ncbi:MAG: hypothetical protein MI864_15620 [Pseudomonadales bacterium]|uniref:Uncharacterized protein n=1 Tax=Oleiphilus messinensis TaxID=141451 RepID=A0A1Y0I6P8_9GAMM|nr:hypothetical protein [Oleiphilus messinensis]ARU55456.1 hypothetical protein OLMES_1379 [Oleiphilus messinensis]MCG8611954.1 hypothetical protein [Pseudomonadales bacterium]